MPSKHTSGTTGTDIPAYPTLVGRLGENPARYLCTDMSPWPILRGIEDFERASAYLAVARAGRRLARHAAGRPGHRTAGRFDAGRERLGERFTRLVQIGERPAFGR